MSEVFSGRPGRIVELPDTIEGFGTLLEGGGDDLPEASFYMMGGFKEAEEQARKLQAMTN
jgi:F0F1-type ATP synthase beta subunit